MDLLKHIQNKYDFVNYIILYGELFGGVYNHQDVTPENTAIRVQKGIHYAPYNDFYAFDIALNGETYLNVHECNHFLDEMGFLYAKSLFEGTFEEALRYPNDQNSMLPSWLELPELESNISEGVIIKPVEVKYFRNGSRVVLKNKNEKWSEKSKIRKSEAKVQENSFSKEVNQMLSRLDCYITHNRWNAVVSKEGLFDVKFLGKYMGLFAKDILEDFYKEHLEDFNQLEKEAQKKVTKQLQTLISKFRKKKFCYTNK